LSSNELHRKLRVNKSRYTTTRNRMIKQGYLKKKIEKNRIYLHSTIPKIKDPALIHQIKCEYCFTNLRQITFIQINKKRETD
jgi:hypothetical protein